MTSDKKGQEPSWPPWDLSHWCVIEFQELFTLVVCQQLSHCSSSTENELSLPVPHGSQLKELGVRPETQYLNPSKSSPLSVFTKMGIQKEKLGRDSGLNAFLNELGRTKLA